VTTKPKILDRDFFVKAGSRGGKVRAEKASAEQLSAWGKKGGKAGAAKRWAGHKKKRPALKPKAKARYNAPIPSAA